jgi:hypothetical protein
MTQCANCGHDYDDEFHFTYEGKCQYVKLKNNYKCKNPICEICFKRDLKEKEMKTILTTKDNKGTQ